MLRITVLEGLLALAFAVAGCTDSTAAARHWSDPSYSTTFRPIVEAHDLCLDCVRLERLVELGDRDGPGFLLESQDVIRDAQGHYWVAHLGALKVFDANGDFMKAVGREGEGPGEFRYPKPVHADSSGRIHVLDPGNARMTILAPDLTVDDEWRLPAFYERAVPLDDGRQYIANIWLPTPDQLGLPIHTIDRSSIAHSYGAGDSMHIEPLSPYTARRILAADNENHVFAAKYHDFEVEVWTPEGQRVTGYSMPSLNDRRHLPGPISETNPYPNTIVALYVDRVERLWVITWRPRDGWLRLMEEVQQPNGDIVLRRKAGVTTADLWTGRIDVIDLNGASIIARAEPGIIPARFLDDGTIWAPEFLDDGSPVIGVWRIALRDK